MANTQEFVTVIKLNDQEAKNNLEELRKKVENLRAARDKAIASKDDNTFIKALNKQLKSAQAELKAYSNNVSKTMQTLQNLSTSSVSDIEKAMRSLKRMQKDATNPDEWNRMQVLIDKCSERIEEFKDGMKGAAVETRNLATVMGNLNTASLNQLNKAKSYLESQIAGMNPQSSSYATASSQLQEVKARIQQVNAEQQKMVTTIDRYNAEIEQAGQHARKVASNSELINRTLGNLKTSSVRDLQYSLKLVNEELQGMDRGTKEFRAMEAQAKRLRTELEKVRTEGSAQRSWIGRAADGFNRMQGMILSVVAAITGLSLTIRKCVNDYALMDQEMTNVRKYTGQTKEEVEKMNETFKKMDTRTPREKLNQLAGDAGRLGITVGSMVEEFVDGADKINVALGDDLGEDAVKNIGKLATMFGEDKRKGLRGAMLATGSAVNELSQSSSAAAGYLVDFTARLSGVGKQANLTQQQIMGYASVLDQNMQQDETSATAMQTLITKMFQETEKFAKLAGKNVKEFSTLLRTDANQALLQFFSAMKAKGGFAELAPMFEQMNLNGVRATGVLSVIADKLEDVKTAQDIANKAYEEGTSVIKEYEVQMSGEQAKLDLQKKKFRELSIQLGKELMPVVRYTISTTGVLVKTLFTLITFVKENTATIITLTASIASLAIVYNLATIRVYAWYVKEEALLALQKISIGWTKAKTLAVSALQFAYFKLTGQVTKANRALVAMRAASIANPFTAVLAVIISVTAAIYFLVKAIRSHNKAIEASKLETRKLIAVQKDMEDMQKKVSESTAEEMTRLRRLTNIVNSNVYSYGERKNAMMALEKIVPGYKRNLKDEAELTEKNNKALKDYIDNLTTAALAKAMFDKMVEIQAKKFELEAKRKNVNRSVRAIQAEIERHPEYYNATETVILPQEGFNIETAQLPTKANKKKHGELKYKVEESKGLSADLSVIYKQEKQINDMLKNNKKLRESYDRHTVTGSDTGYAPTGKNNKIIDPKKQKEMDAAASKAEAKRKKKLKAEIQDEKGKTDQLHANNMQAYSQGEKSYRQYIEDKHQIAIQGIENLMSVYEKYNEDSRQLEDDRERESMNAERSRNKFLLADAERKYQRETAMAHAAFRDRNSAIYMDEAALNEALFAAEMSYLQDRLDIVKEHSEEAYDIKQEMEEKEQMHVFELQEYYLEKLEDYRENWGKMDVKKQEEIALKGLEDLYAKKLIKEEEFQKMRREIILAYAEKESEENLRNSDWQATSRNANSAYNTAKNNATAEYESSHDQNSLGNFVYGDVAIYMSTMAKLKEMYANDAENYAVYQEAKRIATSEFLEGMVSKMQAAYDQVSQVMNAMSSYYEAQSSYEQQIVTKKYEKQIEAASNNEKKQKVLEEKKQKELAKIKSKYNKKQMKIELAQAFATTAMAAINAYASAPKPTMIWGPIAAAMATAAGMLQIATIKKQHAAQEEGYYKGGFTGGKRYRKEAGVVHEGEFVANHSAVNNTRILPALQLIDQAQQNNTVGSLTADDISRSLGNANATIVSAPTVNVQNNNEELASTLGDTREVIGTLTALLASGIVANVSLEDFDRKWKHYQQLKNNK